MKSPELLDYVLSDEFKNLRDTPRFVSERRRVIDCQIQNAGSAERNIEHQLLEIQTQLDHLRTIAGSPIEQVQHIVLMIEERVLQLEKIATAMVTNASHSWEPLPRSVPRQNAVITGPGEYPEETG